MAKDSLLGWLQGDLYSIWLPIFRLSVENGKLLLKSPLQRFEFNPEDIVELKDIKGLPRIALLSGIRIYHNREEYPSFIVFNRAPDVVRAYLKRYNFYLSDLGDKESGNILEGWPTIDILKLWLPYMVIAWLTILFAFAIGSLVM